MPEYTYPLPWQRHQREVQLFLLPVLLFHAILFQTASSYYLLSANLLCKILTTEAIYMILNIKMTNQNLKMMSGETLGVGFSLYSRLIPFSILLISVCAFWLSLRRAMF
jgi:hypothetical protein